MLLLFVEVSKSIRYVVICPCPVLYPDDCAVIAFIPGAFVTVKLPVACVFPKGITSVVLTTAYVWIVKRIDLRLHLVQGFWLVVLESLEAVLNGGVCFVVRWQN